MMTKSLASMQVGREGCGSSRRPIVGAALLLTIGACNLNPVTESERQGGPDHASVDPIGSPPVFVPAFGAAVVQAVPPPPISGGTLAVTPDGRTAIASDPDRDRVYVIDIAAGAVATAQLAAGEEPGRVAIDDAGRAYVILRGAGAVLTLDLASKRIVERRSVCNAPRGVAFDSVIRSIHIACADGQLVTMPAAGGEATQRLTLERDLRDVVVGKSGLWVSRFRSAGVLRVSRDGSVVSHVPRVVLSGATGKWEPPNLAWRMIPAPPGSASDEPIVSCQQPTNPSATTATPAYYGTPPEPTPCTLASVAGRIDAGSATGILPTAVLPVDIAASADAFVVVAAGNAYTKSAQLIRVDASALRGKAAASECVPSTSAGVPGQPIAAAFAGDTLLVQSREPAVLHVMTAHLEITKTIALSPESCEDTGHAIFHSNSGTQVACASCHAEGGEDGRTWDFPGVGLRRTPSLRGTVANTEPYHWDGEVKDIADLVHQVFVGKMSGPPLTDPQTAALKGWLYAIPAPPRLTNVTTEAALRGGKLFEANGCSGCHAGAKLTNNTTVDVGTGGLFQVPSLVGVGWRAPFLHDGCAATLKDRFGGCGGVRHGNTKALNEGDVSDLVGFLETL